MTSFDNWQRREYFMTSINPKQKQNRSWAIREMLISMINLKNDVLVQWPVTLSLKNWTKRCHPVTVNPRLGQSFSDKVILPYPVFSMPDIPVPIYHQNESKTVRFFYWRASKCKVVAEEQRHRPLYHRRPVKFHYISHQDRLSMLKAAARRAKLFQTDPKPFVSSRGLLSPCTRDNSIEPTHSFSFRADTTWGHPAVVSKASNLPLPTNFIFSCDFDGFLHATYCINGALKLKFNLEVIFLWGKTWNRKSTSISRLVHVHL